MLRPLAVLVKLTQGERVLAEDTAALGSRSTRNYARENGKFHLDRVQLLFGVGLRSLGMFQSFLCPCTFGLFI